MASNGFNMFQIVKREEVPADIRRPGRKGQWTQAVQVLQENVAVGEAIALTVAETEENRVRTGIVGAIKRSGTNLRVKTRTKNADIVDGVQQVTIYIIRQEDAVEGQEPDSDNTDD